jgi:hypothetical protein
VLRAAQFHEFVGQLLEWGKRGDVSYVPKMRTQRVEAVSNPADPELALLATGALLPGPGATLGGPTFEEWLDAAA